MFVYVGFCLCSHEYNITVISFFPPSEDSLPAENTILPFLQGLSAKFPNNFHFIFKELGEVKTEELMVFMNINLIYDCVFVIGGVGALH